MTPRTTIHIATRVTNFDSSSSVTDKSGRRWIRARRLRPSSTVSGSWNRFGFAMRRFSSRFTDMIPPRCWTSCPVKLRQASSLSNDGGVRSTGSKPVSPTPKATSGPLGRETPHFRFAAVKQAESSENRLVAINSRWNLGDADAATVNCGRWSAS